jgi:hypothetical protein
LVVFGATGKSVTSLLVAVLEMVFCCGFTIVMAKELASGMCLHLLKTV